MSDLTPEPPAGPEPGREADAPPAEPVEPMSSEHRRPTRISATWVAVAISLILLILLVVFILQNQGRVRVHFLWFGPKIPLGVGLLLASVIGGIVVAISGLARIAQLRRARRTAR